MDQRDIEQRVAWIKEWDDEGLLRMTYSMTTTPYRVLLADNPRAELAATLRESASQAENGQYQYGSEAPECRMAWAARLRDLAARVDPRPEV